MTDKLNDLMERVRKRFEEVEARLVQLDMASNPSHGVRFDTAVQEAENALALAMSNLLDGHSDRRAVARSLSGSKKSKYGSFPALRLLLENEGKRRQSCVHYDQVIGAYRQVIRGIARKRATIAHTQEGAGQTTVEELQALHDDLLRVFADIWKETYGKFLQVDSFTVAQGLPVQTAKLVPGKIHRITLKA